MAWAEKLPSGRYRGVYRDAAGRRRTLGETFTHKARAERAAAAAEDKARRTLAADRDGGLRTWGEWVEEWWPTRQVEPQTLITDAGRRANHLEPRWGDVQLAAIRRHDVNAWVTSMTRAGVGPGTVAHCVRLLSVSLSAAVEVGILEVNPAARVRLPPPAAAAERYLERAEYCLVRDELASTLDQLIADWLVHTGLRFGELAGLHRARFNPGQVVDDERVGARVRVVETFEEKTGQIKAYPKGRRVRDVPVPGWLAQATLDALEADPGECGLEHRGGGRCRSGLLITGPRGGVLRDTNWGERRWKPAVTAAGIGHCRVHDLRHTYASWLLAGGVSLARVGLLLGHSSPLTTQRYAHLAPGDDDLVLGVLGEPVRESAAPRLPHAADAR